LPLPDIPTSNSMPAHTHTPLTLAINQCLGWLYWVLTQLSTSSSSSSWLF
jgi:hypothetical protein